MEIDDWNSIQDMLVLLIEMLSLIKANNRRILVCIKGNHVSPTDVFHNYPIYPKDHRCDHRMIRTSSSQSKTVSDASKGEAKPLSFVPKIRAGRDTFVYFTSYDSLVDSIIQDFNSPEFESGTDFDLVILVDPKRNMTELESIIPLSLFAKKLIILGGNSLDERKPNLFRILSKNLKPIVNQDKEGVRDNQAHVSKKAKYSHHYGPSHLNHLHPAAVRQHMKLQS